MKIAIGSDHAGFYLKEDIKKYLDEKNIEVIDMGPFDDKRVDYPDYGHAVGHEVIDNNLDFGIVICGSGIGISISSNKVKGIRAALCSEPYSAKLARRHNDANVLAMGARLIGHDMAIEIVEAFLNEKFEGGRHISRVKKIEEE
ncbi:MULTISPECIES: ribose 5-phosphate isomerase B [Peptoniphilus]|jgi:ribose-5-phosphate isomerase B|uniref:ribose 5-phosphate isomerase B n=1 Tax=Peptoniphilus TaxID=162289 RepID=UPI000289F3D0|nr:MULTISPECIES: ribose 5-phosphate isomerase B [Peptoniphilus]MBS6611113.1 ribose 5-phosphate isomerase B [Peptoniphilus harei]MDU1044063.1 ribose 5-phosphate isomerase B [Peptoniphilus rhinitidis]MDU1955011.1 ribose 5-phosphate isomerase B [Peptoniphilus lacydonensis]MDU2109323.1 ribose 5-phosphate isomerase B [Peptoniphilus lacydonensis]MDU2115930.1 ribose 5-phosphate isomerase B [Peptoniphilus lacydonensis]